MIIIFIFFEFFVNLKTVLIILAALILLLACTIAILCISRRMLDDENPENNTIDTNNNQSFYSVAPSDVADSTVIGEEYATISLANHSTTEYD